MDRQSPDPPDSTVELVAMLSAVARGDRPAFTSLYDRTSAKLYGIIARILRNDAEAEEVLQDVYLSVWRNAARFDRRKASPITWLAVLARNRAIDFLRRRRVAGVPLDAAATVVDDDPSALEVLQATEDRGRLRDCLGRLDSTTRTTIETAFVEDISYRSVAELQGEPEGTVKSRIRRGLNRLKECLES